MTCSFEQAQNRQARLSAEEQLYNIAALVKREGCTLKEIVVSKEMYDIIISELSLNASDIVCAVTLNTPYGPLKVVKE